MLSRTDIILMTIFTVLLAVGIPIVLIFIDAHIVAKIIWTLLALVSVVLWCQSFGRFRKGRRQNEKPTEFNNRDAYFCAGAYFVSSLAAYFLLDYSLEENIARSWEIFAWMYTYIGICLPIVLWRLNRKRKNE